MTPLELSILIHYHVSPSAFKPVSEVADEAVQMFVKGGLLEGAGNFFATTQKGVFFIEHLLNTPFPEATFTITREADAAPGTTSLPGTPTTSP